jgi:hypothetical protein
MAVLPMLVMSVVAVLDGTVAGVPIVHSICAVIVAGIPVGKPHDPRHGHCHY